MRHGWLYLILCFVSGCFNGFIIKPINTTGPLEECVVKESKGWTWNKVAVIDVSGMILNLRSSGLFSDGENPVSLFREKLEAAADDPDVRAVVLRINSPGGAVTASDIMYQDLVEFRHKTGKPVVACLMDVAASGGYYLAMGCDCVYAHPTTVTGSIGVIMNLYNAEGLCKTLGIESDPIKSGPNKDLGNPTRKLSDEERAIMQQMVDHFYDRFLTVVAEGRRVPKEELRSIADGRVYSAAEAKALGLIDEIGYLEDAIREAKLRAGIRDAEVIAYDREPGGRGTIYAGLPSIPSEINVRLNVPGMHLLESQATFMYLWQPGLGR
jgi:protease-4